MSLFTVLKDTWRQVFGIELPVGDWDTAGPPADEHPIVRPIDTFHANIGAAKNMDQGGSGPPHPAWSLGIWNGAHFMAAHPARIGAGIRPMCVVVHTTDMHPDTFNALVKNWTTQPGAGNAAHFLLGRDESFGVIQFCSITRNGNHAGGPKHGWYKPAAGAVIHPNTISVGIELHCAGRVYKDATGQWRAGEFANGKLLYSGATIPREDVYIDPQGHGWHKLTEYQLRMLGQLLKDLAATFPTWPDYDLAPNGTYKDNGVPWASLMQTQYVGHVTLDPINKTDPGPQGLEWIKEHY